MPILYFDVIQLCVLPKRGEPNSREANRYGGLKFQNNGYQASQHGINNSGFG